MSSPPQSETETVGRNSGPDEEASVPSGAAQEVLNYITTHDITPRLNDVVNRVVMHKPDDPFGAMSDMLMEYAKPPTIARLFASDAIDDTGKRSVSISLQIDGRNIKRTVQYPTSIPVKEERTRDAITHFIDTTLSDALTGFSALDQSTVDDTIA